jgi:hypothetical protein
MAKKTIIIIVLLILATVLLFIIALKSSFIPTPIRTTPTPSPLVSPQTRLMIEPAILALNGERNGTLQVNIDSQTNEITGVQLEMQYDPQVLSNVTLEPGPFLPEPLVIRNNVDAKTGRISVIFGVTPQQNPVKGKGTVAVIKFSTKSSSVNETDFTVLPTSEVTAQGVNTTVLQDAVGAKISL